MATVSIKARLPSDPDPLQSPPDAVESYPPNQLLFLRTQKHVTSVSDLLETDYVRQAAMSSLARWVRLEALGLVANERVDNIKVWFEDSGSTPAELQSLTGLESVIMTNCSEGSGYYGSRTYGDAMYTSNLHELPTTRPGSAMSVLMGVCWDTSHEPHNLRKWLKTGVPVIGFCCR